MNGLELGKKVASSRAASSAKIVAMDCAWDADNHSRCPRSATPAAWRSAAIRFPILWAMPSGTSPARSARWTIPRRASASTLSDGLSRCAWTSTGLAGCREVEKVGDDVAADEGGPGHRPRDEPIAIHLLPGCQPVHVLEPLAALEPLEEVVHGTQERAGLALLGEGRDHPRAVRTHVTDDVGSSGPTREVTTHCRREGTGGHTDEVLGGEREDIGVSGGEPALDTAQPSGNQLLATSRHGVSQGPPRSGDPDTPRGRRSWSTRHRATHAAATRNPSSAYRCERSASVSSTPASAAPGVAFFAQR